MHFPRNKFPKCPKTFRFTNQTGHSQVLDPHDLYASFSTVEILSSHGFLGCSLCLICWLFFLFLFTPLGWQQHRRFKTWLCAFLPHYSPPWSIRHPHYWTITLHRCFRHQWTNSTSQIVLPSPITHRSLQCPLPKLHTNTITTLRLHCKIALLPISRSTTLIITGISA